MSNIQDDQSTAAWDEHITLPGLADIVGFLFRWWPLLVIGMVISGAVAMAATVATNVEVYVATVRVVVLGQRTAATFEPRVRTVSSQNPGTGDAASPGVAPQNFREYYQALADLAISPEIERDVVNNLGNDLPPSERAPGVLLGMVSGKVDTKSNLIKITVRHKSFDSASIIANSWGRSYEKRVNMMFSGLQSSLWDLQGGTDRARQTYLKAEKSLTAFVNSSLLKELSRTIDEKEQLLAAASKARADATRELALAETKARSADFVRVLQAEVSNKALGLQKEQEAKNRVFSAYVDAAVAGKQALVNQQVQLRQKELADLYATDHQLDLLIDRAQALRDQMSYGGGKSSALALVLLKAGAFASSQDLPQNLQLQIGSDALNLSVEDQAADASALLQALQGWRGRLASAIQAKSNELLEAGGYRDVGSDNMLPKAIEEEVRRSYLSLFQLGGISNLPHEVPENNELSTEARRQASSLAQNQSLQQAIELQAQKTGYDEARGVLEGQLRDLYEKFEEETSQQKNLSLERDIAWDSYVALSKKTQEIEVELLSPKQQELQVTGEAMVHLDPSQKSPIMMAALASSFGLVFFALVGFVVERIPAALASAQGKRPDILDSNRESF